MLHPKPEHCAAITPAWPAIVLHLLFRKKIANGSLVLAGIAAEACGDKILKTVVAAFSHRSDMVQRGGEAGKLLVAITALVGVPLIDFDAILSGVVVVDIGGVDFRLRLYRRSFRAELPARLNFIGDQDSVQRAVPVWFTFLPYRPDNFQSAETLTNLFF